MDNNYLSFNVRNENKVIHLNPFALLKDLVVMSLCCLLIISYVYILPNVSMYLLTYVVGLLLILTSLPVMLKIVVKIVLTFTLGYFLDVNQFIENFGLGFILFSVGFLLFILFILINMTPVFIVSISSITIGSSLLVYF